MIGVRVKVLFFGQLKDITGRSEDVLELPESSDLGSVFARYAAEFPRLEALRKSVVLAHNQRFAPPATMLADGDEIALLPPVSGGTGHYTLVIEEPGIFVALTRQTIDAQEAARRILRGEDGAFVNFEGVVRNNTKGRATRYLDYECYERMAIKTMADARPRNRGLRTRSARIAMVHRLGRMEIGETSVAIIVTAPHRRPAFEAALEGINRLEEDGADLEEGILRRWRSLGRGRVGRIRLKHDPLYRTAGAAAVLAAAGRTRCFPHRRKAWCVCSRR